MTNVQHVVDAPMVGAVPFVIGLVSVIRIPIPGTRGLAIEFRPRNFDPKKSTCALFLHDISGKRTLRLDYSFNKNTNLIEYHWNQKGTFADFGIRDHTTASSYGGWLFKASKAFRYGGNILMVVGVAADMASIVQSSEPLKRSTQVLSAWALAWAGAESAGAMGAAAGTFVEPGGGTALLGVVFAIGGGIAGYRAGAAAGAVIYDWGRAVFIPLPIVAQAD